jgi:Domain of unknown function (DUF4845)
MDPEARSFDPEARCFNLRAGIGRVGVIVLLLLAVGIYLGAKLVPPYVRDYQLANAFDDEARRAHLASDDEIRRAILAKARDIDLGVDLEEKDIVVERDAPARRISVYAAYDVEVELIGGKAVTLHFEPEVDVEIRRR